MRGPPIRWEYRAIDILTRRRERQSNLGNGSGSYDRCRQPLTAISQECEMRAGRSNTVSPRVSQDKRNLRLRVRLSSLMTHPIEAGSDFQHWQAA